MNDKVKRKKKTTSKNLTHLADSGATVEITKKKVAKAAAEKAEPVHVKEPALNAVIFQYIDSMKVAVVGAILQASQDAKILGEAFQKSEIKAPDIIVPTTPPIKSIHVTNVTRGAHGGIEGMDLNILRENVH